MKYNQAALNKVEKILDEAEYVVRYERGNFNSGYCILEAKKVVVLNRFLSIESRINTLIDLLPKLDINIDLLTHESQKLLLSFNKKPETTDSENVESTEEIKAGSSEQI